MLAPQPRTKLTLMMLALSFSSHGSALAAPDRYEPLSMHGHNYPNSCAPSHRTALRNTILSSKVPDAATVWQAVDAVLCAPGDTKTRRFVRTLLPKKILQDDESTGDTPSSELVTVTPELVDRLIAGGRAWSADVSGESDKLQVQYYFNEACIRSLTFTHARSRWLLSQFGEACD